MINTSVLKGAIAEKGLSQRKVAKSLGMSEKTFYSKMRRGVFDSDEIETMIDLLELRNPWTIFFAKNGT